MESLVDQQSNIANKRQKFTAEEDAHLIELVKVYGTHSWKSVSKQMNNRTSRQCRERYNNYLSPNLINGPWTLQEDHLLISKVKLMGPNWCRIVSFFPTRSDVNIKNRYAYLVSKGRAKAIKSSIRKHVRKSKPKDQRKNIDLVNMAIQSIDTNLYEKIFSSESILDFENLDLEL